MVTRSGKESLAKHIAMVCVCFFSLAMRGLLAGPPSLEYAAPPIGSTTKEFEVILIGASLQETKELVFYRPGLECLSIEVVSASEVKVKLRAKQDAQLGSYPFRLRSSGGFSELRTISLGSLPLIREDRADPGQILAVDQNVTIVGLLEEGNIDSYEIDYKQGDRIAAEIEAVRLGVSLLDTILRIRDPQGKILVEVDDTALFHQDPFVTLIAPENGKYKIEVFEANYQGDSTSWYALHLGKFPRPSFVFPPGIPLGEEYQVVLEGDAMGPIEERIHLVHDDQINTQSGWREIVIAENGLFAPTPQRIRVSPFPNVIEAEPNDAQEDQRIEVSDLPTAFNGILERDGDTDFFTFNAVQGTNLKFETFADRLGSPADTMIAIIDSRGRELVSNDDAGTHDSMLEFSVPVTGKYSLRVTEKLAEGSWDAIYRVEATEVRSELSPFLPRPDRRSQDNQTIAIPQGNRVMVRLGVQRSHVEGAIQCQAIGLPKGITGGELTIPQDRYWMPMVLEASTDAAIDGTLAEIRASTVGSGKPIEGQFRQEVDLVGGSADALYHSIHVDRLAVAVVDRSPFAVEVEQPTASLAIDGTLNLLVRVRRDPGFDQPVDVYFPLLPPMVDGPAKITVPGDSEVGIYKLRAHPKAEPRQWPICCEAKLRSGRGQVDDGLMIGAATVATKTRSSGDWDRIAVCSPIITLKVEAAPIKGQIGIIAGEQGKTLSVECLLETLGDTPEKMVATLEGLPNRVSATPVEVTTGAKKVTFSLQLDPTAPVGSFDSLLCRLVGMQNEEEVSYLVGRGGRLEIFPKGELQLNEAGELLSPLEVLRRRKK